MDHTTTRLSSNAWPQTFLLHVTLCVLLQIIPPLQTTVSADESVTSPPWYQIEVIVFENLEHVGLTSEIWANSGSAHYSQIIELKHPGDQVYETLGQDSGKTPAGALPAGQSANMPAPYELLDSSQLQLIPIIKKLERSRSYKPILHIAWRQPTLDPTQSLPVFIFDSMTVPYDEAQFKRQSQATSQDPNSRFSSIPVQNFYNSNAAERQATAADTLIGPTLKTLSGTLRLSVSRYLHLEVDLDYRTPILKEEQIDVEPASSGVEVSGLHTTGLTNNAQQLTTSYVRQRMALQPFRLFETRKMRSKEVHYFDHPMFGVIARVIPYEVSKTEPNFDPASQAFTPGAPESQPQ